MRVLVCGGREFKNKELLYKTLDKFHKEHLIDMIIEGNARGADRMAGWWARSNKIDNKKCPALWDLYGKGAGFIRNKQMLDVWKPDIVLAFPGGKGTANMIELATKADVTVRIIEE